MAGEAGSFWTTIPGLLTAAAAVISAVAGLVTAFKSRPAGTVTTEANHVKAAAVDGAWRAQVTYSWGVTQTERFAFQTHGDHLTGTVTYLGVPRGIESGAVTGNEITFVIRAEELVGSQLRPYQLSYTGTVVGGGLHFAVADSRGNPSFQFAAGRDLP